MDFNEIKNFCPINDIIKKVKIKTAKRIVKNIANHTCDKIIIPRIYKEHLQLNTKRIIQFKNGQRN